MSRGRYVPRPLAGGVGQPFVSAEEAWLWFGSCQLARLDGARLHAGRAEVTRPCDPDDIYRAVLRLYRGARIGTDHLKVLGRFALLQAPPSAQYGDGAGQEALWAEALDRLEADLRSRGIVA